MSTDPQIDLPTSQEIDFLVGRAGGCEECGSTVGVERECGRTAYHYEGESNTIDDPNRDVYLCRKHAAQHHEHWDAMWDEYYTSRL